MRSRRPYASAPNAKNARVVGQQVERRQQPGVGVRAEHGIGAAPGHAELRQQRQRDKQPHHPSRPPRLRGVVAARRRGADPIGDERHHQEESRPAARAASRETTGDGTRRASAVVRGSTSSPFPLRGRGRPPTPSPVRPSPWQAPAARPPGAGDGGSPTTGSAAATAWR